MTTLTMLLFYCVIGFGVISIIVIFDRFISDKIFRIGYQTTSAHSFFLALCVWPAVLIFVVGFGLWRLVEVSFVNYLNWLSNILGDKK